MTVWVRPGHRKAAVRKGIKYRPWNAHLQPCHPIIHHHLHFKNSLIPQKPYKMLNLDLILLSLSAMALASPTGSLVERQNPPPPAENQFPWSVEVCTDKEMGGHCSKPMISSNYVLTSSGCCRTPPPQNTPIHV